MLIHFWLELHALNYRWKIAGNLVTNRLQCLDDVRHLYQGGLKIERKLSMNPFSFLQLRCYPPVKRWLTAHPVWHSAIPIWAKWLSFTLSLCGDTEPSYLWYSIQPSQLKDWSVIVVIVQPPLLRDCHHC